MRELTLFTVNGRSCTAVVSAVQPSLPLCSPRGPVGQGADQRGAQDAAAVLDRADESGNRPCLPGKLGQCAQDGVGDDEARRRDGPLDGAVRAQSVRPIVGTAGR